MLFNSYIIFSIDGLTIFIHLEQLENSFIVAFEWCLGIRVRIIYMLIQDTTG
jgi:hypothetical protein